MSIKSSAGLHIVSYNIRQGGSFGSGNSWQKALSELQADIVCAQETLHPERYLADDYRNFAGCVHQLVPHGKWGSAILSRRYALEPLDLPEFEGWVVGARILDVEVGGKNQDLDIYSVHIQSPGPYVPRVDRLIDVLSGQPADRVRIVAGDFNMTVSIRHAAEKLKNTGSEKRIQRRLRCELGLMNAWQVVNPNLDLPQNFRWTRDPSTAYHCDGVFVDHRLLPSLDVATVMSDERWSIQSDHNPLVVVLR